MRWMNEERWCGKNEKREGGMEKEFLGNDFCSVLWESCTNMLLLLGFDELFCIYHNDEEKDLNICTSKITSLPFQPLIILFNFNPCKVVWTEGVLIACFWNEFPKRWTQVHLKCKPPLGSHSKRAREPLTMDNSFVLWLLAGFWSYPDRDIVLPS